MKSIQEHPCQLLKTAPTSNQDDGVTSVHISQSEHFKQSANITSEKMSIKMLHCTATIHLLKRCMACSNLLEIGPDWNMR